MRLVNLDDLIERYKWPLGLAILGLILVGLGILALRLPSGEPKLEIT